jgi:organic radical activating enzyme
MVEEQLEANVVEIFRSLEGEGNFIGTPTIFVRLAGCNVGCKHCDSKLTWKKDNFPLMSVDAVLNEIYKLQVKTTKVDRISITGGEPLLNLAFVLDLCDGIMDGTNYNANINLETSGTIFPKEIFDPGCFATYVDQISLDIKTPSSGVVLNEDQISNLKMAVGYANVYTKAVIGNKKDLEFILDTFSITEFNNLILTPCEIGGKFFSTDEIFKVLDKRKHDLIRKPLRVIAQQHKTQGYR